MNSEKLQNLDNLYISAGDIARELDITKKSAQVAASRLVAKGILIRLKRDLYILRQNLNSTSEEDRFFIANLLQTPSYVSLTSALSYYNLTTQQMRNFVESIALKRTTNFEVGDFYFNFQKVKREFYSGFTRNEHFFISQPAKALADCIYLTASGFYNADFEAIDLNKFDKNEVEEYLEPTNKAAKNLWQKLIKSYGL